VRLAFRACIGAVLFCAAVFHPSPVRAVDLRDVLTDYTFTTWSRKDGLIGPVWAFAQDGLTTDRAPIAARVDAGHEFGALLLLMAAVLLAAGLALHFLVAQRPPAPHTRRLVEVSSMRNVAGPATAAAGTRTESS